MATLNELAAGTLNARGGLTAKGTKTALELYCASNEYTARAYVKIWQTALRYFRDYARDEPDESPRDKPEPEPAPAPTAKAKQAKPKRGRPPKQARQARKGGAAMT